MLLVVICRWCDVDVCRDPGNVSTSIIAQHTVTVANAWECESVILNSRVVAFARQREITGEPLNSRSRILAPNRREITGVDCISVRNVLYLFLQKRNDVQNDMNKEMVSSAIVEGNTTIKSKRQLSQIIDTTLLKCYLQVNNSVIGQLDSNILWSKYCSCQHS